ncbi:hypothetical protein Lysil_2507 [Lysobacter silvestris]|uniref:Uncharacterized protein n=2 Tax=Solilutibacter silvestris TaxID=1645665 RepID=A0A2K1PZW2_9GAMM|nr:hypothetical protein Lysil_2507 [Lysobacter silvestris]
MSMGLPRAGTVPKAGEIGATRACPHCKATILESAPVCPACKGHLRFGEASIRKALDRPLAIEGTLSQPPGGVPIEYSVVIAIRNERGEEVGRHVVGVGAMQPGESRTFSLAVDVFASTKGKLR